MQSRERLCFPLKLAVNVGIFTLIVVAECMVAFVATELFPFRPDDGEKIL